jgi:ribosome-binding factor A
LPCDSLGPDDLIDPKLLFRPESRRHDDRHVRRLCSQVREALTYALAGCRDEILQSLYVETVEPAPDATRLAAVVRVGDAGEAETARARLAAVAAMLRAEVASSIHRRRAPELVFRVLPAGEAGR